MTSWFLRRLLWMVPTLFGISFVTFMLLELAPLDRARLEVAMRQGEGELVDRHQRDVALLRLQIRYGLVDAATGEPVPVWQRFGNWFVRALRLELAGPDEDQQAFRGRLLDAAPVSLLLGFWALVLAVAIGVPLGASLGIRAGSRLDRLVSAAVFLALGFPEVLVATLLVLAFGPLWLDLLPDTGLRSPGSAHLGPFQQLLDLAWHLVLPVAVMALVPALLIMRFLRESVARVANATFAVNLRAWGLEGITERWRLLRAGSAPLATLVGSLLPALVTGSIVVESVFSIDGLGRLLWQAVRSQDQAMVMAITLLTSLVTLLSLVLSDLLHRLVDPRVRLDA